MSELFYLISVLLGVAAYIVAGVLLWVGVEGIYWLYCKARGIKY